MTDKRLRLLAGQLWMDLAGGLLHYLPNLSVVEERAVEELLVQAFKDVLREQQCEVCAPEKEELIVFTNGCFDILHIGHVRHLEQSRALGTRLVVGINSDASVRAIKGSGRPIMPEAERVLVLKSLRCVDDVHVFEADIPDALIKWLHPHVLTKGPECAGTEIPGAAFVQSYGGQVVCTAREYDTSTTEIVEKLRRTP